MSGEGEIAGVEHALERLFRLSVSRGLDQRQAAAVGAVVTRAGYAVLRVVEEAGEISLGELAKGCSMDPAAAGRQVRVLEDEGFLERTTSVDDGRVALVRLTPAGRDVYRRIVEVRRHHMAEVMASWSSKDRRTLASLVDRLVDDLKAVPFRPTQGRSHADA